MQAEIRDTIAVELAKWEWYNSLLETIMTVIVKLKTYWLK